MAEIRVEPKRRSMAWLWILVLIAIAAGVAWYFMNDGRNQLPAGASAPAAPAATTVVAELPAAVVRIAARITS
jgi:hypothetical protein